MQHKEYTVTELLNLSDNEFIQAMDKTVWAFVHSRIRSETRTTVDWLEAYNAVMRACLRSRNLFKPEKNKTFIPWSLKYYGANAIRELVHFNTHVVAIHEATERWRNKKGRVVPVGIEYDDAIEADIEQAQTDIEYTKKISQFLSVLSDEVILSKRYGLTKSEITKIKKFLGGSSVRLGDDIAKKLEPVLAVVLDLRRLRDQRL